MPRLLPVFVLALLAAALLPTPAAAYPEESDRWYMGDVTVEADVFFDESVDCFSPKLRRSGNRYTVDTHCRANPPSRIWAARLYVQLAVDDGEGVDINWDSCTGYPPTRDSRSFTLKCTVTGPRS